MVSPVLFTTQDGINETLEGSVISHTEMRDGGATVFLMDGRAIIFADCECYAVVFSKDILQ
jgi:hypothetical protein